ncbi:MAG: class I tRNA ligase family protein [Candidatus Nanopelagicales bacterium]
MINWPAGLIYRGDWFSGLTLNEIEVFDSQTQSIESLELDQNPIPIYVCGLTPYDSAHLGHAFTYSIFDVLVRFLRQAGKRVTYVQNITDVDDPLFERARRDNQEWSEIAKNQIDKFIIDMQEIGVNPPDVFTPVSEQMPTIQKAIAKLETNGDLYELADSWYYRVQSTEHSLINSYQQEELIKVFAERGGDPERVGKLNPLDPVVWKPSLPREPNWDSPLGPGRPGWHIECVGIIEKFLDLPLFIQGGGKDLIFPHHTMCAWQTKSLTNKNLARSYLHAGLVSYQGEKMSKSLGNLVFISELLSKGFSHGAIRAQLLSVPWSQDWEWFEADLVLTQKRVQRWGRYLAKVPADSEFITSAYESLKNNLSIEPIFQSLDELESKTNDSVQVQDSVQAFVSDVLGLKL